MPVGDPSAKHKYTGMAGPDSKLRRALKRSAEARGLKPGSARYNAYVYGTINRIVETPKKKGG